MALTARRGLAAVELGGPGLALLTALCAPGCLRPLDLEGYACDQGVCAEGYFCDPVTSRCRLGAGGDVDFAGDQGGGPGGQAGSGGGAGVGGGGSGGGAGIGGGGGGAGAGASGGAGGSGGPGGAGGQAGAGAAGGSGGSGGQAGAGPAGGSGGAAGGSGGAAGGSGGAAGAGGATGGSGGAAGAGGATGGSGGASGSGGVCVPFPEICDGIVNDCSPPADDSPVDAPPCALQLGVCEGSYADVCGGVAGWEACSDATYTAAAIASFGAVFEPTPSPFAAVETVCDGLDSDCDGQVDDGCVQRMVQAQSVAAITVDGDLSDWNNRGWIALTSPDDYLQLTAPAESAADLSARFALRWRADTLWLAVEVTDEAHFNDRTGGVIWQGDCVQAAFDVADNGGTSWDATDDFEYGWAETSSGDQRYRWVAPAGSPNPAGAFVVQRANGLTVYEVALTAADLGLTAFSRNQILGFSLAINENDNDGFDRRGALEWSSGIVNGKVPDAFGTLELR